MPPPEVLARLHATDWKSIYPSLMAYATARGQRLPLVKGGGDLPLGEQARDVVQEAIRLVFTGERQWDPERDPDLQRYLAHSVIRSLVNNLATRSAHAQRDAAGFPEDVLDASKILPDDVLASDECIEAFREIGSGCVANDERLETVMMGLEDGMARDEIASLLSIEVKEVYTLTRKLRRRLEAGMAGHECWDDHPVLFHANALAA